MTPVADWLPPALRDAPDDVADAPRLLDLLLAGVDAQRRAARRRHRPGSGTTSSSRAAPTGPCPYIGALLGLPPDAERLEVAYAIALRRRKGTPAALEDFAEVVTGLTARVRRGLAGDDLGAAARPPAAAARRVDVDLRDGAASGSARRSTASATASRRPGPYDPRAATAVVWPWQVTHAPRGRGRAARRSRAASRSTRSGPRRRSTSSRGPRAAERATRRRVPRTGDELDAPVRAHLPRARGARSARRRSPTATNWTVDRRPPACAGRPSRCRPGCSSSTLDGAADPVDELRFGSLPPGAPAPAPPRGRRGRRRPRARPRRARQRPHRHRCGRPGTAAHRRASAPLASDARRRPGGPRGRDGQPGAAGGRRRRAHARRRVHEGGSASRRASTRATRRRPPRRRDPARDLRPARRAAAAGVRPDAAPLADRRAAHAHARPSSATSSSTSTAAASRSRASTSPATSCSARASTASTPAPPHDGSRRRRAPSRVDARRLGHCALRRGAAILGAIRADLGARPVRPARLRRRRLRRAPARLRRPSGRDAARRGRAPHARFGPRSSADGVTFAGAVRAESLDAVDCVFADGVEAVQQQEGCLRHCFLGPDPRRRRRCPVAYRCGPFPPPTVRVDRVRGRRLLRARPRTAITRC